MTNKKNWLGILVLVLVFGMVVVGCGNKDGATTLTENKWAIGSITDDVDAVIYSFSISSGKKYNIWVNDSDGDGSYSADVRINGYHSDGSELFRIVDDNWDQPESFTATSSGKITIRVEPYYSTDLGTFAIVYSTNNNRP